MCITASPCPSLTTQFRSENLSLQTKQNYPKQILVIIKHCSEKLTTTPFQSREFDMLLCSRFPAVVRNHIRFLDSRHSFITVFSRTGKGTIHDLYKDLDLMRDVTSMLNEADNSLIKNYKDLADICKIAIDEYESLQPPCAESPTKLVLDDIVRRKPTFTVEELFTNFRDMKRVDVIQAICSYFRGEEGK